MAEKKRILVVDGDPNAVAEIASGLRAAGYEVATAESQEEAEQVLLSFWPNLAIIELMLEHWDSGFVLCHHLKTLYPGTPVILLTSVLADTGLSFDEPTPEAHSWVEVDRFLDKPARWEQVAFEVRRLLGEPANASPAHA